MHPQRDDPWTMRVIIIGLIGTLLICVGSIAFIGAHGRTPPPGLGLVATGIVTYLCPKCMAAMTLRRKVVDDTDSDGAGTHEH